MKNTFIITCMAFWLMCNSNSVGPTDTAGINIIGTQWRITGIEIQFISFEPISKTILNQNGGVLTGAEDLDDGSRFGDLNLLSILSQDSLKLQSTIYPQFANNYKYDRFGSVFTYPFLRNQYVRGEIIDTLNLQYHIVSGDSLVMHYPFVLADFYHSDSVFKRNVINFREELTPAQYVLYLDSLCSLETIRADSVWFMYYGYGYKRIKG